jgi:hypothetical protein
MKTPRVDDFDPRSPKAPALKSTLDEMPAIEKPQARQSVPVASPVLPVRVVPPVLPVPHTRPQKRVMKQRHPFDIYQDQYDSLRDLATEERKQGGLGSMSAMVRDALDAFIAARKKK